MTKSIIANHSYYQIPDFKREDNEDQLSYLEKSLSVFDKRTFSYYPIGYYYDEETNELRIPRGYPHGELERFFKYRKIQVDQKCQPFDLIDMKLFKQPREPLQIEVMSFLCGLGKHSYTKKFSQVFCDLHTGKGKTYCTVSSLSFLKMKTAIFIPSKISKLIEQWYDAILQFTNKRPKDILIVKGSKMCEEILEGEYKDKEIFIFSKGTVLSFAKTHGWAKFQEMMEMTRVGVKIIDEAHMDMRTNVLIDCNTNIKKNIYLTASALRGDRDENGIFKKLFSNVPIMGKDLVKQEDNYINMLIYQFRHKPTTKQRLDCKVKEGLSAANYSRYLASKDGALVPFFNTLSRVIKDTFVRGRKNADYIKQPLYSNFTRSKKTGCIKIVRNKKFQGKLLILGATREFLGIISRFLKANFPEYSIGMYTGDIKPKERERELEKDIILGTEKGIGTGADIKDLQFMINLIPYSNPVSANQLPGRLRYIGHPVFYSEIVNIDFNEAANQYTRREKYLKEKAKNGRLIVIEPYD